MRLRPVRLLRAAAAVLALLAVVACATERGSGFSREAGREQSSKSGGSDSGSSGQQQTPKVTINAQPSTAQITVSGKGSGRGSFSFDSSGLFQSVTVTVEAPSYRTQTFTVNLSGQTDTIQVNLEPILGTLVVRGPDLDGALITADGVTVGPGPTRVLIGQPLLKVRRFGFLEYSTTVSVAENQTTSVDVALQPAPFSLTGLASDHPAGFNPESAAVASVLRLRFRAAAPGHALLVLTDSRGREWGRWAFGNLQTWEQGATWTGRDDDGGALPDGTYLVTLSGGAEEGVDTESSSLSVTIDRSFVDRDRPSLGPAPGLLWSPSPEILSPGTIQVSMLVLGHQGADLAQFPLSTTLRFSPAKDWEFAGQTSFRLWSDRSLNSVYGTFALKHALAANASGFRAAWVVGGTLATWLTGDAGIPPTDYLTTFPALRALLPVSFSWGRWTLMLAPEVDGSLYSPATAYEAAGAVSGPRAWAYGRAGLSFDPGPFSVAVSGAARTRTFDDGAGFLAPAQAGLELRWPVPESPLTLTGYLSVSAYSTADYAWYGGLGLSLLLPPQLTLDVVSQALSSP